MYSYVLFFHIISFISWMAALFYLPRLFVYHIENSEKKEFVEVVKIQEEKLYKFINIPAEIATIISGAILLYLNPLLLKFGFMHMKLLAVLLLLIYSHSLGFFRKRLENNQCNKSGKFFRIYNELPTLLMIVIVYAIILKPF